MRLPEINPEEDKETLSNNNLIPLFDPSRFVFRKPDKDKGIDWDVELKTAQYYTGFSFVIQLKSTSSEKKNANGSVSVNIESSNINYLMNSGKPAFYILYLVHEKKFLYANANDFFKKIVDDKGELDGQDYHALQFIDPLNEDAILAIYNRTIEEGNFHRSVREAFMRNLSVGSGDKVIIDENLNVLTDSEIRTAIENSGFYLINEGRWSDVVRVHEKGSQAIATTKKYNLIVGVAYYLSGELAKALYFLRAAALMKEELQPILRDHLIYFNNLVKFSVGIISKEEYEIQQEVINKSTFVGYLIKLNKLRDEFSKNVEVNYDDAFGQFMQEINGMLEDPSIDEGVKIIARCETVLLEGKRLNAEYATMLSKMKHLKILPVGRPLFLKDIYEKIRLWAEKTGKLKEEILDDPNPMSLYHVVLDEIKVDYEFIVYDNLLNDDLSDDKKNHHKKVLLNMVERLDIAITYYEKMRHIENLVVAVASKYEILHFLGEMERANETMAELSRLVEIYELRDHKRKLEMLKKHGAIHEQLAINVKEAEDKITAENKEGEGINREIAKMDKGDLDHPDGDFSRQVLEIYPLGYFTFPDLDRTLLYDILNVDQQCREIFDSMFESAIPIANVLNDPILTEGKFDGVVMGGDIATWRRILKIRKALFDKGYKRVKMGTGK